MNLFFSRKFFYLRLVWEPPKLGNQPLNYPTLGGVGLKAVGTQQKS